MIPEHHVLDFINDPVADPETDCILCGHLAHPGDVCTADPVIAGDPACPCSDPWVCEGYNVAGRWVDCDRPMPHAHGIVADMADGAE